MKNIIAAVAIALGCVAVGGDASAALVDAKIKRFATKAELNALTGVKESTYAYVLDTNTSYVHNGTRWMPLDRHSPEFYADFTATTALATLAYDSAAPDLSEVGTSLVSPVNYGLYGTGGNAITFSYVALADTGQTANVAMAAAGLNISGDATDNEGYEVVFGYPGTTGRPLVTGVDPAFRGCASITVDDISDTDELVVGFRRAEQVRGALDDYTDMAAITIDASAATGVLHTETIDDNGNNTATELTTSTWADGATKVLCVSMSSARAVTYTVNGSAPAEAVAFTWDAGDPVVFFVRWLHSTSAATVVTVAYAFVEFT